MPIVTSNCSIELQIYRYCGQQPEDPFRNDNIPSAQVCRLCKIVRETVQTITTDNYFTSTELPNKLLNEYKLTLFEIRSKF